MSKKRTSALRRKRSLHTNRAIEFRQNSRAAAATCVEIDTPFFEGGDATESQLCPYEENLLERARTQWQFGDWSSLAELDRDTLQHHPDRAKLSLLAAAGHLQQGNVSVARQFTRLAQEWGCDKKLISQVLIAGVHNTLGRAASIFGQENRAMEHFNLSVALGTPGSDARLLAQARASYQCSPFESQHTPSSSNLTASRITYAEKQHEAEASLFRLGATLPDGSQVSIPFNANASEYVHLDGDALHYSVPEGKTLYLCSNEDGNFSRPPITDQFGFLPNTAYKITGHLEYTGNAPVIWAIEYDEKQRIGHATDKEKDYGFGIFFRTHRDHANLCIAIRLAGEGTLRIKGGYLNLCRQSNEDVQMQRHLENIARQSMLNATRQLEALAGVQHYLATGERIPDMHGWPISPDLALYLIDLLEKNHYDLVIEFGSGTSTVLIARALATLAPSRKGCAPVRQIAFEHLEQFQAQTYGQLEKAGMADSVQLVLAPLEPRTISGESYPFYPCDGALRDLAENQNPADTRILVFVDGPPAATGKHARYPAVPAILGQFAGAQIDILIDDYIREDEKEIVQMWLKDIKAAGLQCTMKEIQMEKGACLITIQAN